MSSSKNRNFNFENIKQSIYTLDSIQKSCVNDNLSSYSITSAYSICDKIAYINNNKNKLKAFALLYPLKSGRTLDKKDKSVKFMLIKVMCANKQNRGYGKELLLNIEERCRNLDYEYIVIDEPIESALGFYIKCGYEYIESGTIDGCMVFDSCWKKIN